MEVRLHARNTDIDDLFRRTAVDKVAHAVRVFDQLSTVDVELTEETNPRRNEDRYRVELTASVAGRVLRVESSGPVPEAALDDAVDRFTRRLRRWKERLIDTHRRPPGEDSASPNPDREPVVVRTKQFLMKPLTVEEAALQMDLLGHDFFFFLNAATNKQSVLYRRRDGRLGLIEPA